MKIKIILWIFVMMIMVFTVVAEPCYTIINSPDNNNLYWKINSYNQINYKLTNWLSSDGSAVRVDSLGSGQQYTLRVEKDCYNQYIPSQTKITGIKSNDIVIDKISDSYKALNLNKNDIYTVSIQDNSVSGSYVKDMTFKVNSSFQDYGLCDPNFKVTKQLQVIRNYVWDQLEYGTPKCTSQRNIVECVFDNGKGENIHYSTAVAVIAQKCGIETRVIKGISQGHFNGINIVLDNSYEDYWIEFYDNGWHSFHTSEVSPIITKEYNCRDGIDNDGNGKIDCFDDACSGEYQCNVIWPKTKVFDDPDSTDLTSIPNPSYVKELRLKNNYGVIEWYGYILDLAYLDIDQNVNIEANSLILKNGPLDYPANVKLFDMNIRKPEIVKDGNLCVECEIISSNKDIFEFTVPGAGAYSIRTEVINFPQESIAFKESKWYEFENPFKDFSINNLSLKTKVFGGLAIIVFLFLILRRKKRRFHNEKHF